MRLIFFPLIPPAAFLACTQSCTPLANDLPTSEVTPVRSNSPPTLISLAGAAAAFSGGADSLQPNAVRIATAAIVDLVICDLLQSENGYRAHHDLILRQRAARPAGS